MGPFEVEEIRTKILAGELRATDPCIGDDGSADWQPISARLAGQLPNLPPAPPPPAPGGGIGPILSPVAKQKLGFGFDQFLFLRRMLTPTFIQIIYVVGLGFIVLGYLLATGATLFGTSRNPYGGYSYSVGPSPAVLLIGYFVGLLVSLLAWRIYCELLIVIFRIHDFLRDIRDAQAPAHPHPSSH